MFKVNEYQVIEAGKIKEIFLQRLRFDVPLDYHKPHGTKISVVASLVQRYDPKLHAKYQASQDQLFLPEDPKVICYVQGGPGFPCAVPTANTGITKVLIDKGYQVLYLDQRGTGYSTPLEWKTFEKYVGHKNDQESDEEFTNRQLEFVLNFRADSIVEDFEHVRKILLGEKSTWSLIGQSYGGFVNFTYLSNHHSSLKEVLILAGVPPVGFTPDQVHTATYERTRERNEHFYSKYPQDVAKVKRILDYIHSNKIDLPNGGNLSVERFQQMGLGFGSSGGTDKIHRIVTKFDHDLEILGYPTHLILCEVQNDSSFDTNNIYALFLEAIYCDGNDFRTLQSNWASDRLRYVPGNESFVYSSNKKGAIYFTGEMIFKSLFDDFSELRPLKALAYALHSNKVWSKLYDPNALSQITFDKVPIVAATYVYDQYVDFDLTREVKKKVFKNNGNLRQYITSEFFHNGVRVNPEKIVGNLFDLLDEEID